LSSKFSHLKKNYFDVKVYIWLKSRVIRETVIHLPTEKTILQFYHCNNYNKMGGACSIYGEVMGIYRDLVGRTEGKRILGTPRCRWEDNIKMKLQAAWDIGYGKDRAGSG
jgi:hypothetical protein